MKMMIDRETMRRKIAQEPDLDVEAGMPVRSAKDAEVLSKFLKSFVDPERQLQK